MPDVPSLPNFENAVRATTWRPTRRSFEYCAAYPDRVRQVFGTLCYLDVVNDIHAVHAEVADEALTSTATLTCWV